MIESWQDLARLKRPSEDRLIERYRLDLFRGPEPAEGRGYSTTETPWGIGRQFWPGMFVTSVGRRSAWPETQIVLHLFLETYRDRQVVVMSSIWPPEQWQDPEPPYNDMLDVNIAEWLLTNAAPLLTAQNGPVIYLPSYTRADLADPPAPGEAPPELLDARDEIDRKP